MTAYDDAEYRNRQVREWERTAAKHLRLGYTEDAAYASRRADQARREIERARAWGKAR